MPSWSIGHSGRERVEVLLLSPPANDSGYDWVSARTHLEIGAFRAEIPMMILASDMTRFLAALEPVYRDLRGIAEFNTIEGQLGLRVECDCLGHVRVTGHVTDDPSFGNRLTFTLEFDQTILRRSLSELRVALSELQASAF